MKRKRQGVLDRIAAEKRTGKVNVQRFKGLGEMNPLQLRETTMAPDTRRLVRLTLDAQEPTFQMMDMLAGKKAGQGSAGVAGTKGSILRGELEGKWSHTDKR